MDADRARRRWGEERRVGRCLLHPGRPRLRSSRITRTSAGAIVRALIAAGMPAETCGVMRTVDYGHFQGGATSTIWAWWARASRSCSRGSTRGGIWSRWFDGVLMDLGRARSAISASRPELLRSARAGLQARHHDLRCHQGKAGARFPWDYPRLRVSMPTNNWSPTPCGPRCRSRSSSTPVSAVTTRANGSARSWSTAACCRTSRSRSSTERTASRPLAHVRDQALVQAGRPSAASASR